MTLLAAYPFDEQVGTTAADVTGNGNTLTLAGSTTWAAGNIDGAIESAVGSVNGAAAAMASPTAAATLMCWVFPVSLSAGVTQPAILYVDGVGSTIFGIFLQRGDFGTPNVLQGNIRLGGLNSVAGTALTVGVWQHVALVYDGTQALLYLDGVQNGVTGALAGSIAASTALTVCGQAGYSSAANMRVSGVRIYDEALSQSTIATLMNESVVPTPPVTSNFARETAIRTRRASVRYPFTGAF